jgi:hypothetical protein
MELQRKKSGDARILYFFFLRKRSIPFLPGSQGMWATGPDISQILSRKEISMSFLVNVCETLASTFMSVLYPCFRDTMDRNASTFHCYIHCM